MSATVGTYQNGPSSKRLVAPNLSLLTRIYYYIGIWGIKAGASTMLLLKELQYPTLPMWKPTMIVFYPCRPKTQVRLHIPESHVAGEKLPLYIDLHGSGFTCMHASMDDEFCSELTNRHNIICASISYSKAPGTIFPVPSHEIAEIGQALIDDEKLPIDKTRVALGGFSAGGNLALSAVQLPELQGKIKALVAWYPVLDLSIKPAEKAMMRPYKKAGDRDQLLLGAPMFDYAYVPAGQLLKDPLLSPAFMDKSLLPEYVYVIGAEYDMLANEARKFMFRIAGIENPTEEEKYEFTRGGLRWTLARDVEHGFTHFMFAQGEAEEQRKAVYKKAFDEAGEWLAEAIGK
jgi:acetyl esterase/lipase